MFRKPTLKKCLESILHPLVRAVVLDMKERCPLGTAVIAEIPLLFESGWQKDFDLVIAVSALEDVAMDRVIKRDDTNRNDVAAIIEAQMKQELKCEGADYIVDNSGDWLDTERCLVELGDVVLEKLRHELD